MRILFGLLFILSFFGCGNHSNPDGKVDSTLPTDVQAKSNGNIYARGFSISKTEPVG